MKSKYIIFYSKQRWFPVMFSQSWSNNTEQPVLFYYPQWHHHWWLVYLILCKLRDLPCYSTIKTSQQTDRGVDGTSDSPLTMFPVAVLLLLAAGSCESPWICQRVTTFSFAGQLDDLWQNILLLTDVKCERLTQPASVTVQPGQPLTISCQVSYSVTSYWTHWIRQPAGKGLEWIGMRKSGSTYYKDSLKNKFSIDLDSSSNTVTLKGQNVQPGDTAVYYCAKDTMIQTISRPEQKPLSAWTLVTWSHQRRSPKTTGGFRPVHCYCKEESVCFMKVL